MTNPKVSIKYGSAVKGLMFDNTSAAEGAEAPSSLKGSPRCTGAVIRDEPGKITLVVFQHWVLSFLLMPVAILISER